MADGNTPTVEVRGIPLGNLTPYAHQARKVFDAEALAQLAESIRSQGVIQPIIVRPREDADGPQFEIIAGERRWRAAQLAGLETIPAIVRIGLADQDVYILHLTENLQRENLSLIEECSGCAALVEAFGKQLAEQPDPDGRSALDLAAERLNQGKPWVSRRANLKSLPPEVGQLIADGKITSIDIAYDVGALREFRSPRFKEVVAAFEGENHYNKPPTREGLRQLVSHARVSFELKQEAAAKKKAEKAKNKGKPKPPSRQDEQAARRQKIAAILPKLEAICEALNERFCAIAKTKRVKQRYDAPVFVSHEHLHEYGGSPIPTDPLKARFALELRTSGEQLAAICQTVGYVAPAKLRIDIAGMSLDEALKVEKMLGRPLSIRMDVQGNGSDFVKALTAAGHPPELPEGIAAPAVSPAKPKAAAAPKAKAANKPAAKKAAKPAKAKKPAK